MVRVSIKGGIWKNSEDEILKAAVQKYGKQQWARVASLLNRKTAKQAKARWHEWLDPSIKKTADWSREEEEKLLHLAKLLPAQWKTIGPLVGNRTANQCQEHYEYLLDQAATASGEGGEGEEGGSSSVNIRKTDAATAIAHPETKPARPDAIDMDEDELEMLQEARARLANTQGKKAKRKERERMLAQAKRLADLQKRRELKQAGLLSEKARTTAQKRNRDIDLGVEIPFHKPAPAGFHDVSGEDARAEAVRRKRWKSIDYNQINQQQYKTRDREAAQLQKREQARLRLLEQSNDKYAEQQRKAVVDDTPSRPRMALRLPEPGISQSDRREYDKLEQEQHRMQIQQQQHGNSSSGGGVTATLLGDYTDRPLPTPLLRNHQNNSASAKRMDLVQTATHLRKLQEGQTPLLPSTHGGTVEDEEQAVEDKTNDEFPKPSVERIAAAATPLVPAPRDELGLNEVNADGTLSVATFATDAKSLARHERRAAKQARDELSAALQSLPAPQYEYELAVPQTKGMDDEEEDHLSTIRLSTIRDRADIEADERKAKRNLQLKELGRRSMVLQRSDLPRPPALSVGGEKEIEALLKSVSAKQQGSPSLPKDSHDSFWVLEVQKELMTILAHDSKEHSTKKKTIRWAGHEGNDNSSPRNHRPASAAPFQEIPQSYLDEAKAAIAKEVEHSSPAKTTDSQVDDASEMCYIPEVGWVNERDKRSSSLLFEFETLRSSLKELRRKNDKMAAKAKVVHGGYKKRADKMRQGMESSFLAWQAADIEQHVFEKFAVQEQLGGEERMKDLSARIQTLKQVEASLQKQYGALSIEKKRKQVAMKQRQSKM